jgi:hypothetical protein
VLGGRRLGVRRSRAATIIVRCVLVSAGVNNCDGRAGGAAAFAPQALE